MGSPMVARQPKGLLRWLLRMPILLYRLRLGWLLGSRFLLLHHIGRKSGLPRRTVVEVVDHDKARDVYAVASGWGTKADWYRNVLANPDVTIRVGRRTLAVRAETLPPDVAAQALAQYRERYPRAARELSRVIGVNLAGASREELEQIVSESLPLVAFHPRHSEAQRL